MGQCAGWLDFFWIDKPFENWRRPNQASLEEAWETAEKDRVACWNGLLPECFCRGARLGVCCLDLLGLIVVEEEEELEAAHNGEEGEGRTSFPILLSLIFGWRYGKDFSFLGRRRWARQGGFGLSPCFQTKFQREKDCFC